MSRFPEHHPLHRPLRRLLRRPLRRPLRRLAICLVVCATATPAATQTIADFSRAQRARIDATLLRTDPAAPPAAAVAAAPAASAPTSASRSSTHKGPAAAQATAAAGAPDEARAGRAGTFDPATTDALADGAAPEPDVEVTGALLASSQRLAEVNVAGSAFVLAVGDTVPGTRWAVQQVSDERVVLRRLLSSRSEHADALWSVPLVLGGR